MVEIRNLSKTYQSKNGVVHALKSINLTIPQGDICGIIGKSGAGKSSLLRCINLLERPTTGTVVVNGKNLLTLSAAALREVRHDIGMIFQHFNLLAQYTVYQNIALPLQLMGVNNKIIKQKVLALLDLVGLVEKQHNYPAELSGGQKQRVAIARAIVTDPKILLCDEATSALDQQTTSNILSLLKDINQQFGITIILITHEIDVVKQICDHVVLMQAGEIIEQAELFDFFAHPKTVIAQDFVASSFKQALPVSLQQQFVVNKSASSHPVLRIIFHGKAAAEPLIAHLMQHFGLTLNILQANIEFLKHDALGIMITEVMGDAEKLEASIQYLQHHDVKVEIIAYVNRTSL